MDGVSFLEHGGRPSNLRQMPEVGRLSRLTRPEVIFRRCRIRFVGNFLDQASRKMRHQIGRPHQDRCHEDIVLSNVDITRRLLLRGIGVGSICLAAIARPGLVTASPRFDGRPELRFAANLVRTAVPHHRNAARLGQACLRAAPQEYDLGRLLKVLTEPDSDLEVSIKPQSPDMVRSAVRRRIKGDFDNGALVEIDG